MSDITLSDLWVFRTSQSTAATPLTAAEFDRIAREQGYAKRPVCENCEGDPHKIDRYTCPSCGGTGFDGGTT